MQKGGLKFPYREGAALPVTWQPIPLKHGVSIAELRAVSGVQLLNQLQANVAGALASTDPEYLHQLRIAIRRLRALLSVAFSEAADQQRLLATRELKWLGSTLGVARDTDVFVEEIWPSLREEIPASPLIERLEREWRQQKRESTKRVRRALRLQRFQRLLRTLARCFGAHTAQPPKAAISPQGDGASTRRNLNEALRHRSQRVRRRAHRMGSHDAAALHEWRIDIRKLRYLIEVYSPVLAKTRSAKLPKKLSRLQNILGAMNDIAMAHRRVEAALTRKRSNAASLHQALRNWQTTRLRFLTKKLRSQWRKIRRDKKLWRRFESAAR